MARWVPALQHLPERFPFAAFLLAGVTAAGFIITALTRPWYPDVLLSNQVEAWRATGVDVFAIGVTLLGDPFIMILTGLLIILWVSLSGQHRLGAILLISSAAMVFAIPLLKATFQVMRPDLVALPPSSEAFPSGHSAGAALFLGLLTGFANQRRPAMSRWHLYLPAGMAMVIEALSRVWLGVHWLSDVVAGLCLGLFLAALTQAFHRLSGRTLASLRNSLPLWLMVLLTAAAYLIIAWPMAYQAYRLS